MRGRERGCIVDAIADHRESFRRLAGPLDDLGLIARQRTSAITRSMPSCRTIELAVRSLSPVSDIHCSMILARLLSRQQMLLVTQVSASVFDRMINRGGMALTFGVPRAIVRDRYVSTDPVYARAIIEFGRQFHVPQPDVCSFA